MYFVILMLSKTNYKVIGKDVTETDSTIHLNSLI